jgi:hypothetical protein
MKTFNPDETDRVRRHSDPEILNKIERDMASSVRFYSTQPVEEITRRIEDLEREWDIERVLETNAAALGLTGALFGLTRSRKWLLLTCVVTPFLFQHAVSGWCPPVPVLRRLGFRTRSEIDREKFALKVLRGDFSNLPQASPPEETPAREVLQTISA